MPPCYHVGGKPGQCFIVGRIVIAVRTTFKSREPWIAKLVVVVTLPNRGVVILPQEQSMPHSFGKHIGLCAHYLCVCVCVSCCVVQSVPVTDRRKGLKQKLIKRITWIDIC